MGWSFGLLIAVCDVSGWSTAPFRLEVVKQLFTVDAVTLATAPIHYVPLVSTVVAAAFTGVLYRHWRTKPGARYLMWWMIGVGLFGLGTLTEGLTTLLGWHEPLFRTWYIAGALLGGAPLAQGTVYLLFDRARADRMTVALVTYVTIASVFVLTTPIIDGAAEEGRLTGSVMEWTFVRFFSPFVNLYALVFLVGGAIWSALRYRKAGGTGPRVRGNWLIAIGALLPGIGGTFTRLGHVEVLYAMELLGLILIWSGYRAITGDMTPSIHQTQIAVASAGVD